MTDVLQTGPQTPLLILAHGAGAPMDSEFMERIALLLAERNIGVVRFEFPYMSQRRSGGKKRPPDRQAILLECWQEILDRYQSANVDVYIGGKSMGGRMASLIADDNPQIKGVVCLGYPFHPAKKPEKLRTEHLGSLSTPALMVQGTRDALGNREEVETYTLSEGIQLCWLEDGDHDLKPRVRSGFTHEQHLTGAADAIVEFIRANG